MQRVLGYISCDLDPKVKVNDKILYFYVNAIPKPLDVTTSNSISAYRSHDVEGTGQHLL